MKLKKIFLPLLVIGIILRLFISATTFHPDLRAYLLAENLIVNHGEVFSFYDHISKLSADNPLKLIFGDDIFIYQPLAYFIPSFFYLPFSKILSPLIGDLILNSNNFLQSKLFYLPLIIFKLPFLVFDLLILFFLPRLFPKDKRKGRLAQIFWLFNPVSLLVASGMGQSDVFIAFFLLMSLIYLLKKKTTLATFFVSLSALIKPIGLILIPFYILAGLRKDKKTFFANIIAAVIPFVVVILPFLNSPAYKNYALLAQHASKSIYAGISIASGHVIPYLFIALCLSLILYYYKKIDLITAVSFTLLSSLFFTHFHPQWFIWVMPFLIYLAFKKKKGELLILSVLAWLIILFSFEPSLHLNLFIFNQIDFSFLKIPFFANLVLMSRAFLLSLLTICF